MNGVQVQTVFYACHWLSGTGHLLLRLRTISGVYFVNWTTKSCLPSFATIGCMSSCSGELLPYWGSVQYDRCGLCGKSFLDDDSHSSWMTTCDFSDLPDHKPTAEISCYVRCWRNGDRFVPEVSTMIEQGKRWFVEVWTADHDHHRWSWSGFPINILMLRFQIRRLSTTKAIPQFLHALHALHCEKLFF